MKRRNFLAALIAAPAIVRAESLMKIVVPRQELDIALPVGYGPNGGDFTIEGGFAPADRGFRHMAVVWRTDFYGNRVKEMYVDGHLASSSRFVAAMEGMQFNNGVLMPKSPDFRGIVDEIRITSGVARTPAQMISARPRQEAKFAELSRNLFQVWRK